MYSILIIFTPFTLPNFSYLDHSIPTLLFVFIHFLKKKSIQLVYLQILQHLPIQWVMDNLPGTATLKKTNSLYSSSYQFPIIPQLGLELFEYLQFPYCFFFSDLNLHKSYANCHRYCEFTCIITLLFQENHTLLQSFTSLDLPISLPPLAKIHELWEEGLRYRCPIQRQDSTVCYSLHLGQVQVFMLIITYSKRSFIDEV